MNVGTRAIRITKVNGNSRQRNCGPPQPETLFRLVTYQGYIYGNDAGFLTCLDLKTGDRLWKGGRYGKGQVLLLENAGLLLVAAEDGQVHLVPANPKEFVEVGSFKALDGKTWNHPVVVGDRLYVRNSQEAAGFQLTLSATTATAARRTAVYQAAANGNGATASR
jgi:outer membrane protein assembly factor BamB